MYYRLGREDFLNGVIITTSVHEDRHCNASNRNCDSETEEEKLIR
jgi:hypothetical protein